MSEVTRIIDKIGKGDTKAADELLPLVYGELRCLAASNWIASLRGIPFSQQLLFTKPT